MRLKSRTAICAIALLMACGLGMSVQAENAYPQTLRHNHVIGGIVVNEGSSRSLDGAIVTLTDATSKMQIAETTTNIEGRFYFTHLPDGRFLLRATHEGYLASAFEEHDGLSTTIVNDSGPDMVAIRFGLQPLAVISGTINDDAGDPVRLARVFLYRQNQINETRPIVYVSAATSDDLGGFGFPRLQPGNYYVAVVGQQWYARAPHTFSQGHDSDSDSASSFPLDLVYATAYYPDVTDSTLATPIAEGR